MTETIVTPEKQAALDASAKGVFSFLDRLEGRNYPKLEVPVYLDEEAALIVMELAAQRADTKDPDEVNLIDEQMLSYAPRLEASKYILHLEGISTEAYDAVIDEGNEAHPVKYETEINPLTMAKVRTPIEDEDRDHYFRVHLWAKYIRSVEAPDGSIDSNITPEWVAVFCNKAPIVSLIAVRDAVEKLRMTTDWMDQIQNEDFFPKS